MLNAHLTVNRTKNVPKPLSLHFEIAISRRSSGLFTFWQRIDQSAAESVKRSIRRLFYKTHGLLLKGLIFFERLQELPQVFGTVNRPNGIIHVNVVR